MKINFENLSFENNRGIMIQRLVFVDDVGYLFVFIDLMLGLVGICLLFGYLIMDICKEQLRIILW